MLLMGKYRVLGLLCLILSGIGLGNFLQAQVVWSESFNYPNGTMVGANNNTANPSPDWVSSCPTCVSGDWYEIQNNVLEARDTNGEAEMVTESIDITSIAGGVEVRFDLSESGPMEGCPGGISSGCNSVDWIKVEYKLNNNAWVSVSSVLGGPCSGACAGGLYFTIGDFNSTAGLICPLVGDSLRLRFTVQTWAADEYLRVDNIIVQAQTCVAPQISNSVVDVGCNGDNTGEILMLVTGPANPYTFSLNGGPFQSNPNFSGLLAGTYSVVVQDGNGNTYPQTIVVGEPPVLTASTSTTLSICSGATGTASVSVAGGVSPYSYAWNTTPSQTSATAINLAPGLYSVTVTDSNGCTAVRTATVAATAQPVVSANPDLSICQGLSFAQLAAQASGGTGPYIYAWSCNGPACALDSLSDDDPMANPATTTTYYIQITDQNGCASLIDSVTVTVLPNPVAEAGPDDTLCLGAFYTLNGSGSGAGPNYSFEWSPGAGLSDSTVSQPTLQVTQAACYGLTVESNGCASNDTVCLFVEPSFFAQLPADTLLCAGDSILLLAAVSLPGGTYEWQGPQGVIAGNSSDSLWVQPSVTSQYTISASSLGGCPGVGDSIVVEVETPAQHALPDPVEFCPGEPLLVGVPSEPNFIYVWDSWEGLADPYASLTEAFSLSAATNFIVANDTTKQTPNCRTVTLPVVLTLGNCLFPNVITPNDDGINDALNLGPYFNQVKLVVWDRWGARVFEDNGYQNNWKGTNQSGAALPEGVYYYRVIGNWTGFAQTAGSELAYDQVHTVTVLR